MRASWDELAKLIISALREVEVVRSGRRGGHKLV